MEPQQIRNIARDIAAELYASLPPPVNFRFYSYVTQIYRMLGPYSGLYLKVLVNVDNYTTYKCVRLCNFAESGDI